MSDVNSDGATLDAVSFDPEVFGLQSGEDEALTLEGDEATRRLGATLARVLERGDFVGLVGNLGAGKTTLVRGLVEALNADVRVSSPTYTLVNLYETRPAVVHVDLYRLEGAGDLETTGYWDYVSNPDGLVLVEWLDRVPDGWPGEGLVLEFEHRGDARDVTLWSSAGLRDKAERIVETMRAHPNDS